MPLLAIGQAVHATGYARVTREILGHLDARFEIHQFGINYRGPHLHEPWEVHPNLTEGDPHGVTCLRRLLREVRPRVLLIVYDTYAWPRVERVLADAGRAFPRPRVVLYSPIEGTHVKPHRIAEVAAADRFVLFHDRARTSVEEAFSRLGFAPPPLAVIPHGVDVSRFRPLHDRRAARRALFPDRPELDEAFLVLNANRNTLRKRVDITLEAFARFAAGKPDAWLYLHMGMHDIGYPVRELAARLGIADRLLVTHDADAHPQVDDEHLNLIYNACDAGLNTSTAEGWGLIAFEHAATGAAQVLPRHSACEALWDGAATLVEPRETGDHPMDIVFHEIVAAEDVAAALEPLYRDRGLLEEQGRRAYARAHQEAWRWPRIGQQWNRLLSEVSRSAPTASRPSRRPRLRPET
ncbi:MAG TPA: glycosyltransferase family 4 protein [Thermoanaerobaculia bacterium]